MSKSNTTPSVLAFERNLDISDAFFTQCNSQDKNPVEEAVKIREKSVRGTISNRLKNALTNDPAKLDAEIQKPNLQCVDVAMLNAQNDMLIARFSCKVFPFNGTHCVCKTCQTLCCQYCQCPLVVAQSNECGKH